jgi:hypothetical protein
MRAVAYWLCGALSLSAACHLPTRSASAYAKPQSVLFVGNSFLFYNNGMHNHYRRLVRAAGGAQASNYARSMTLSGGRLPEHRAGLRQRLAEQRFDVVVMQGHSLEAIEEGAAFGEAVAEYAHWIRSHDARPALLMTWAYAKQPEMINELSAAYCEVGERVGAQVIPVGWAFDYVTKDRPDLELRTGDDKHPTLAGTYLAACTLFVALHRESPEGLAYRAGLSETDASYLQQAAWQVLQDPTIR